MWNWNLCRQNKIVSVELAFNQTSVELKLKSNMIIDHIVQKLLIRPVWNWNMAEIIGNDGYGASF